MCNFEQLKHRNMKCFFTLLALLTTAPAWSQVTIDPTPTPADLVSDFLLGGGVLIENITYTGTPQQIAAFADVDVLGLGSGLVLSTGNTVAISDGISFLSDFGVPGDPDLLTLANTVPPLIGEAFYVSTVNDVASIEFDFIPYGDSLAFNYVFGSDEYLAWINSQFNDVFGFFISGPGITGPYSAPASFPDGAANIAFVPETDPAVPITVSSVNTIANNAYYIDNPLSDGVHLNGYTTPFVAYANDLQIGETYHIRLAIADGSDSALDSGVFLQAGSFTCYQTIEAGGLGDLDGDGDIDMNDLLMIIGEFGCDIGCTTDLDGDGVVGMADILLFLGLFE